MAVKAAVLTRRAMKAVLVGQVFLLPLSSVLKKQEKKSQKQRL